LLREMSRKVPGVDSGKRSDHEEGNGSRGGLKRGTDVGKKKSKRNQGDVCDKKTSERQTARKKAQGGTKRRRKRISGNVPGAGKKVRETLSGGQRRGSHTGPAPTEVEGADVGVA